MGVLLASYTWGSDSQRFEGMKDEDIIEECLEGVAKLHKKSYSYIRGLYLSGKVKKWGQDPETLGAFLALKPYQVRL